MRATTKTYESLAHDQGIASVLALSFLPEHVGDSLGRTWDAVLEVKALDMFSLPSVGVLCFLFMLVSLVRNLQHEKTLPTEGSTDRP